MTFSGYLHVQRNFIEYCLLPEKQMRSHCSFMHAFEEKTFRSLQMQRHAPIYLGKIQLRLIFTLDFIYQRHHHRLELWNFYFLQTPYLQRYADAVAGKSAPLCNCLDFVGGTVACICKLVLNERVVPKLS